jgi:nucleoid-associated protein YgaU
MISLFAVLLVVGCAKPPTKEMADAEAALAAAKLAEADVYVPDEYRSAEDRLAQARAEVVKEKDNWFKNYDPARKAALESKTLAEEATEHAKKAKAQAKAKAEEIIAQLKTAIKEAKAAEAETYLPQDLARVSRSLQEVEADYKAERYLAAISKGQEAIAQAKDLAKRSRLAAAEAKRKEEERRRAEAERRRAEEEARRLAEEELRRHPPTHEVVKGECLWRIAESEKIYSDPFQWPLIYQANRSQIKDPDLIYPKQEFQIKRDASAAEIRQAISTSKHRGPWSLFDGK